MDVGGDAVGSIHEWNVIDCEGGGGGGDGNSGQIRSGRAMATFVCT